MDMGNRDADSEGKADSPDAAVRVSQDELAPSLRAASPMSETYPQAVAHEVVRALSAGATYLGSAAVAYVFGEGTLPTSPFLALLHDPLIALAAAIVVVVGLTGLTIFVSRQIGTSWLASRRTAAQVVQFLARTIFSTLGGLLLGVIAGTRGLPAQSPVTTLLTTRPLLGTGLVALLLLIIIVAPLFTVQPEPPTPAASQAQQRVVFASAISAGTALLFLALLSTVLIQPSWCPTAICPAPFDPNGVHDDNMEAVFKAIQSTSFVLPDDPAHLTVTTAPRDTPAVRIDGASTPYRVVVRISDRRRSGTYPLIIEQVTLTVDRADSPPLPLNVWTPGSGLDYHEEPYLAEYHGQGSLLPAEYLLVPGSHVQLEPGGADELDVELRSTVAADLHFHAQITYRLANEAGLHTLTLRDSFHVVFSDGSNWHPYAVDPGGTLVPGA